MIGYIVIGYVGTLVQADAMHFAGSFGVAVDKLGLNIPSEVACSFYPNATGLSVAERFQALVGYQRMRLNPGGLKTACNNFWKLACTKDFTIGEGVSKTLTVLNGMGITVLVSSNMPSNYLAASINRLGLKGLVGKWAGSDMGDFYKGLPHIEQFAAAAGLDPAKFMECSAIVGADRQDMQVAVDLIKASLVPAALIGITGSDRKRGAEFKKIGATHLVPNIGRLPSVISSLNAASAGAL